MSLDERGVERELRDVLRGVHIVGELDLEGHYFAVAREVVAGVLRRGFDAQIAGLYPASLVVYLVGEGALHYYGGNYWGNLSIPGIREPVIGRQFIDALDTLGLDTFKAVVPEGAYRYVAPILIHAGIPRYCAGDVLRLLAEELRRGAADAGDVLDTWRNQPTRMQTLDRPAQRFFELAGDVAVDLVQRLIGLIDTAAREGALDPHVLGLPQYFVDEFTELAASVRHGRPGVRLPAPKMFIDPYAGSGPTIVLPAVDPMFGVRTWAITGDESRRVPASGRQERFLEVSPTEEGVWTVEACGDEQRIRRYHFSGPVGRVVLLFDGDTGELLRDQTWVRSDSVLLVAHEKLRACSGESDGPGVEDLEGLPPLSGHWAGYALRRLDLRGVSSLWLGDAPQSGQSGACRILVAGPAHRSTLATDPVPGVVSGDGLPVYREPPAVVVELAGRKPGDFRVECDVNGSTRTCNLTQLPGADGRFSLRSFLGDSRIVSCTLHVVGPLGSDLHTRFLVLPGLEIDRPERILDPWEPAELAVRVAPPLVIDGRGGQSARVELRPGEDGASVTVADPLGEDATILVSVARLQWGFRRTSQAVNPIGHELEELAADDFETGEVEALLVRTGWPADVDLHLVAGAEVLLQAGRVTTSSADGRWAFPLGWLVDTIRSASTPQLGLIVTVGDITVEVATVQVTYVVDDLGLEAKADPENGTTELCLHLVERRSFRNRELRLWPADRIAGPPVIVPLADGASGDLTLTIGPEVAPGRYAGEVTVGDAWLRPSRPLPGRSRLVLVEVGSEAVRAARLAALDPSEPRAALEIQLADTGLRRPFTATEAAWLAPDVLQLLIGAVDPHGANPVGSPAFRTLIEVLFGEPDRIAPAIEQAVLDGVIDQREGLRLALTLAPSALDAPASGITDSAAAIAWSLNEVLGAALEPPRWGEPGWRDRWVRHTGWDPFPLLASRRNKQPPCGLPPSGWPHDRPSPMSQAAAVGTRQSRFISLPTDPLPLNEKGFFRATTEWCRVASTSRQVIQWRTDHAALNGPDARLSPCHAAVLDALVNPDDPRPVARFAQDVLAVAIILVSRDSQVEATTALWEAAAFAPRLVTRSLLVAMVLHRSVLR